MCTAFRCLKSLTKSFHLGTHCAWAGCVPQHKQRLFSQLLGKQQPWLYCMATQAHLRSCQHFLERLKSAEYSKWWVLLLLLTLSVYGLGNIPPNPVKCTHQAPWKDSPIMSNITLTAKRSTVQLQSSAFCEILQLTRTARQFLKWSNSTSLAVQHELEMWKFHTLHAHCNSFPRVAGRILRVQESLEVLYISTSISWPWKKFHFHFQESKKEFQFQFDYNVFSCIKTKNFNKM